jgi:hypothetical protein
VPLIGDAESDSSGKGHQKICDVTIEMNIFDPLIRFIPFLSALVETDKTSLPASGSVCNGADRVPLQIGRRYFLLFIRTLQEDHFTPKACT